MIINIKAKNLENIFLENVNGKKHVAHNRPFAVSKQQDDSTQNQHVPDDPVACNI